MATTKAKRNIIVFDFETGGLQCTANPALEIACIALDAFTLEEMDRYESYIIPYKGIDRQDLRIAQEALNYNGISMSTVHEKGQSVEKVVNDLCKFMESANKGTPKFSKPILAGHNVDFDIPFLQYIFLVANKELKKYLIGKDDAFGNFQPGYHDTINLAQQKWGLEADKLGMTLGEVCEYIGFSLTDAHSAMPDVEATVECLRYFFNSMRNVVINTSNIVEEARERARLKFQF